MGRLGSLSTGQSSVSMEWLLGVSLILLFQGLWIKGREGLGSRLLHGFHKSPVSSVRRAFTGLQHILGFLLPGFTSCSFLVLMSQC